MKNPYKLLIVAKSTGINVRSRLNKKKNTITVVYGNSIRAQRLSLRMARWYSANCGSDGPCLFISLRLFMCLLMYFFNCKCNSDSPKVALKKWRAMEVQCAGGEKFNYI